LIVWFKSFTTKDVEGMKSLIGRCENKDFMFSVRFMLRALSKTLFDH
jgi:hypothetical protein